MLDGAGKCWVLDGAGWRKREQDTSTNAGRTLARAGH